MNEDVERRNIDPLITKRGVPTVEVEVLIGELYSLLASIRTSVSLGFEPEFKVVSTAIQKTHDLIGRVGGIVGISRRDVPTDPTNLVAFVDHLLLLCRRRGFYVVGDEEMAF